MTILSKWSASTLAAAFLLSIPAYAQVQVVTVTAQKRAEDVQDVPLAISAFSGEDLEKAGISGVSELTQYTPNFRVDTQNTPRNSTVKIRGIGTFAQNPGVEQSVGIYLDGVYVPRVGSILGDLIDIQSFEVLRGPQGTLYGRNTPVGAVNINTRQPTHDFEATATGGIGNYRSFNGSVMVNGGVSDDVALRGVFWGKSFQGYTKNLFTDSYTNGSESVGTRVKALFEPNDKFNATLALDYIHQQYDCCTSEWIYVSPQAATTFGLLSAGSGIPLSRFYDGTGLAPTPGNFGQTGDAQFDRRVSNDDPRRVVDEQHGAALTLNYDLGGPLDGHSVKSISSYRRWRNSAQLGFDETPADLVYGDQRELETSVSQELQLASPEEGVDFLGIDMPIKYLLGFNYYYQDSFLFDRLTFGRHARFLGIAPLANAFTEGVAQNDFWRQRARAFAFFGQSTIWLLPDELSLTGGVRYSHDSKDGSKDPQCRSLVGFLCNPVTGQVTNLGYNTSVSDGAIQWMASTSYYMSPDIHFYFTAATGYKAPGINARAIRLATPTPVTFDAEKSMDFELGVKSLVFDQRLQMNVNLFRTTIEDFQQNANSPSGLGTFIQNAGKLRVQGVEVDARANPVDWLEMGGSAAFLHSRWVSFTNAPCDANVVAAPVVAPGVCDFSGLSPEDAPKWTGSVFAQVTQPIVNTGLEWFVRGEANYYGQFFHDESRDRRTNEKRYTLFNTRLGVQSADNDWRVTLWMKNIFDIPYYTHKGQSTVPAILRNAGSMEGFLGAPRTLGLEGTINF